MEEPLISVVIPVYNSEKFIDRCLLSITKQSYKNLEIILEDGGSDDGTKEICLDWLDEDKRVKYYRADENKGVSVSRNRGIDHSNGEFITFVDSDDFISKDMIEKLYMTLLHHTEVQSACCRFTIYSREGVPEWMQANSDDKDESDDYSNNDRSREQRSNLKDMGYDIRTVGRTDKTAKTDTTDKTDIIDKAYIADADSYLHNDLLDGNSRCWSRIFRKEAVGSLRFHEDITIGEDMLFVAEFLKKTQKIAILEEKMYYYYQNKEGAMQKEYTHSSFDQITCWEKAKDIVGDSAKLRSIILISIILTVSRISCLSKKGQKQYKDDIATCKEKMRNYRTRDAFNLLDRDYRVKVRVFTIMPTLYLGLYHYLHEKY